MREVTLQEFFRVYVSAQRVNDHLFEYRGDAVPFAADSLEPQYTPACLQVLGLELPCTEDEIHGAFRARAKIAHPDRGGSNEAFRRLYAAYREALARG